MMAMKYFHTHLIYRRKILQGQMKKIEAKELSYVKQSWEDNYRDVARE